MKRYTLYLDYAEVATPTPRKRALGEYETATELKDALETARPQERRNCQMLWIGP